MTLLSDRRPVRGSDLAMAVVGAGWSVLVVLLAGSWQPDQQAFSWVWSWPSVLSQLALGSTLLLRRALPLTVATGSLLGASGLLILVLLSPDPALAFSSDLQLIAPAVTPFTSYAAVLHSEHRTRAWALVLLTTALVARPWAPDVAVVTTAVVYVALPGLLGAYVAARRRLIGTLVERAERAETEQLLLAEAARADERLRLATEVHGVVTERMDRMLRLVDQLDAHARSAATRNAAAELASVGRQADDELRTLLELSGAGSSDFSGPATDHLGTHADVPALSSLVDESVAAGVSVTLDEHGDPSTLSPAVGRIAYRIIREALTNAHRHAPGSDVTVAVRYQRSELRLRVTNSAPTEAVVHDNGSGTGLSGLRQRVELLRGTLRTEPTSDGGFDLDAILPTYVPSSRSFPSHEPDRAPGTESDEERRR